AFPPGDAANYSTPAATVIPSTTLSRSAITWANPADIVYGTALSATQLNATASVAGTLTYTPPTGTVLNAGSGQTLHVAFAPTDASNYNSTAPKVRITVQHHTPTINRAD